MWHWNASDPIDEVENGWGDVTIRRQFSAQCSRTHTHGVHLNFNIKNANTAENCIAFLYGLISFSCPLFIPIRFQTISNKICVFACDAERKQINNPCMTSDLFFCCPQLQLVSCLWQILLFHFEMSVIVRENVENVIISC